MHNKISLLVGLKNNLEYSRNFYETTRNLYPDTEIVFVSYGSTDGTNEWLDNISNFDKNIITFHSEESKTFSDTFNKAAELATKEYIILLHNDIILGKGFLESMEYYIKPTTVLSYTTIEPPIFADHDRPGKIIKDFGTDLNNFKKEEFEQFVEKYEYNGGLYEGVSFFMCLYKEVYLEIGGMDNLFNPMFCEDDDLILRLKLKGLELITNPRALCYHFVSKTSRFSEEFKDKTKEIEYISNRNFVRKWGFKNSKYHKKYDIGFVVKNCNESMLSALEPWCTTLYVDCDIYTYINTEQKYTKFDLKKKILSINSDKQNSILVEFDGNKINQNNYTILTMLSDIITESAHQGKYHLDIYNVDVYNTDNLEKLYIENNNSYYTYSLL